MPCFLAPHEQKKYKLYNPDADLIDITVSMMSGYVDIFVSDTSDVTDQKHKERHSLRKNLEIHKLVVIAPAVKY